MYQISNQYLIPHRHKKIKYSIEINLFNLTFPNQKQIYPGAPKCKKKLKIFVNLTWTQLKIYLKFQLDISKSFTIINQSSKFTFTNYLDSVNSTSNKLHGIPRIPDARIVQSCANKIVRCMPRVLIWFSKQLRLPASTKLLLYTSSTTYLIPTQHTYLYNIRVGLCNKSNTKLRIHALLNTSRPPMSSVSFFFF